jgi:hypothetical protein
LGDLVSTPLARRSCGSKPYDKFVIRQSRFHVEVEVSLQPKINVVPRDGCIYVVSLSLLFDQRAMAVPLYQANTCSGCHFCQCVRQLTQTAADGGHDATVDDFSAFYIPFRLRWPPQLRPEAQDLTT